MTRLYRSFLIAGTLCAVACCALPANGQDDPPDRSQLGERQRLVERKMAELETKFEIIAQRLEAKEPERAQRLIQALQQSKEQLIAKRMNEITSLLDQQRLEEAEREMDAVIDNLDQLVRLLLNEDKDSMSKQQEIEALSRWKEQIEQLKREQRQQTRETGKVANKDQTLEKLQQQIQQIKQLIGEQQKVIEETEANRDKGLQALDRVADRQFNVRQQTEDLARQLGDNGEPQDPAGPSDPAANDRPADPNASDRPNQGNPPGAQQPGQDPGRSGGDPSESGQPASGSPKQPGQQPLEQAAEHQQSAEQELASGKSTEARRAEDKALDELEKALAELEKEQRRIASLPPEALEQMARTQRRTRDKTADVAKEMKEAPQSGDSPNGQSANQGQQQPGQQAMGRAQKSMDNAAGDLDEQDPQKAERQQQQAERELDQALKEIEERLNQLREETREEKLARLEARFREMLTRQQVASVMTIDLDDKQTHLGRLRRRDQLMLLRLATEELEIAELGQQAYDLLLEDGTSIVFPEIVLDVQEDLQRVAQLLEVEQTGALTQMIQREIETTLEELLEALKQARQQQQGGGGGGGGGNQPLLRKSSELKILRAAQLRVNRRTSQFDLIRGDRELDGIMAEEVQSIAQRQAEIVEMTQRVMEKD